MKKSPKYLYRQDDGFRFTRQDDGYYTMDKSHMHKPFKYLGKELIRCGFVDSLDKCKIEKVQSENNGHGNGDFDE